MQTQQKWIKVRQQAVPKHSVHQLRQGARQSYASLIVEVVRILLLRDRDNLRGAPLLTWSVVVVVVVAVSLPPCSRLRVGLMKPPTSSSSHKCPTTEEQSNVVGFVGYSQHPLQVFTTYSDPIVSLSSPAPIHLAIGSKHPSLSRTPPSDPSLLSHTCCTQLHP